MNRVPAPSGASPIRSDEADRGSVLPLLAIVLVAFALSVTVIVATSRHSVRLARAQWAADAAALAVASVGPDDGGVVVGRVVAEANGARIISMSTGWSAPFEPLRTQISRSGTNGEPLRATGMGPVVVVRVDYAGIEAESAAQRFTARNAWSGS